MTRLRRLPPQPDSVPWPTREWPMEEMDARVDAAALRASADAAFAPGSPHGETLAIVAVHRGRLVFERYADGKSASDTFPSWSMAKSMLHAVVGMLVGDGRLDIAAPAEVSAWGRDGDPRAAITLDQLLRMVDGLDFIELYEPTGRSDVVTMLFGAGKEDVAGYAIARPLLHAPGAFWSYSSGTSNVVARIAGDAVGGGEPAMRAFLDARLFGPLGMRSAQPRFDAAGSFIGSSYVFATARDFARFGLFYLRDGIWDGARLLPRGWVDHARRETPASIGRYGAHWWLALDGSGIFTANGFQGQHIVVDASRDLVVVRLGVSTPAQRVDVLRGLRAIVHAFPSLEAVEA